VDLYRWLRNQWDRSVAVVAAIIGAVLLLLGWLGASRATLPAQQIPYLASNGLAGLFALGIGATLWISADLRDEWRKLDEIHRDQVDERRERETRRAEDPTPGGDRSEEPRLHVLSANS
jgi:hypothetical protein